MIIPKSADVIIIGGGVMGASTAFYLAERGVSDIILLEKEELFGQGGYRKMRWWCPLPIRNKGEYPVISGKFTNFGSI